VITNMCKTAKILNDVLEYIDSRMRIFIRIVIILQMGLMALIVNLQVVARYFHVAFIWADEISRLLLVWSMMLGAVYALSDNQHIGLSFIIDRFSGAKRKFIMLVNNLAMLLLLVVIAIQGIKMLPMFGMSKAAATGMPISVPFFAIPFAAICMIIVLARVIANLVLHRHSNVVLDRQS